MKSTSMNPSGLGRLFGSASPMISDRLAGLVRIATVSFTLLLAAYVIAALFTNSRIAAQANLGSFALSVADVNIELLEMRRNEKDFFLRKTKAELDKHAANFKNAKTALGQAQGNAQATADDLATLDKMGKSLDAYNKAFLVAAADQLALGFDENSGLQGDMRKAVRAAEAEILKVNSKELLIQVLTLRRHEKDFLLRGDARYIAEFSTEITVMKEFLAASKIDPAVVQRLNELITTYDKNFQAMAAATVDLVKQTQTARTAARDAEAPVPALLASATERRLAAAQLTRTSLIVSSIAIVLVLGFVAVLLSRSLGTVRKSITSSVGSLRDTVERVRAGHTVGADEGVLTKDEMGQVWTSVDALLTDRLKQQRKAEEENDGLNNSVISILQAVNQLSQRDLTAKAPVTQDIIGTVSDSINLLTDETSKVLIGVNQIASQVVQVSTKVRSQAELVSTAAEGERKDVALMIVSLGDATESMNQIAALAEQSNRSAERATQATETALQTVNGTVKGMEAIRETISETEKRIKRLGERSQEITGIVNLINTISERTHVLALNASMQAAVAGEAGRGFAVVAEEVQRLAESSRNATQQIGTLVTNIQLETNETISTVNRTIGQVVHGSEQAQKAGEQMRLTQEITSELVAQVRRIAEASDHQKGMSLGLLQSVKRIGQSNERTSLQIDAQNEETATLLDSARRLVESVSVFKLPQPA